MGTKEIINKIIDDLNYYDKQPVTNEFSKGFTHCCNVFRKRLNKWTSEMNRKAK